ncbi:MAG: hypothetical protein WAV89_03585 [Ignavibacteriaceae bacterium]
MRQKIITVYAFIFLLLLIILSYYFLYNIYGNEIRKEPENLYANPASEMRIEVIPVNALGWKAIFRSSSAVFDIVEGQDLIDIVKTNEANGVLVVRSKGKAGTVGIKIKSDYSLVPDYIEIHILTLTA